VTSAKQHLLQSQAANNDSYWSVLNAYDSHDHLILNELIVFETSIIEFGNQFANDFIACSAMIKHIWDTSSVWSLSTRAFQCFCLGTPTLCSTLKQRLRRGGDQARLLLHTVLWVDRRPPSREEALTFSTFETPKSSKFECILNLDPSREHHLCKALFIDGSNSNAVLKSMSILNKMQPPKSSKSLGDCETAGETPSSGQQSEDFRGFCQIQAGGDQQRSPPMVLPGHAGPPRGTQIRNAMLGRTSSPQVENKTMYWTKPIAEAIGWTNIRPGLWSRSKALRGGRHSAAGRPLPDRHLKSIEGFAAVGIRLVAGRCRLQPLWSRSKALRSGRQAAPGGSSSDRPLKSIEGASQR
jgi:hypothetical protein